MGVSTHRPKPCPPKIILLFFKERKISFQYLLRSWRLCLQVKQYRMFHDDSMRSFFRRLSFTPDGSFLLVPGAHQTIIFLIKWNVWYIRAVYLYYIYYSWLFPHFISFNSSWLCRNWRKHHKYHLHLFQEEYEEVNTEYMLLYYIYLKPINVLMLAVDAPFLGLSPTYHVRPKPRWQSDAAQYTLSSGQRKEQVRIHVSSFNGVEEQCSCCLHVLSVSPIQCLFLVFPPFCLQMVLVRLSPMLFTYRTGWCLLWHLRTPSYCMTHSRRFPLARWQTSIITHWVTLHGKAATSCIVSCHLWGFISSCSN